MIELHLKIFGLTVDLEIKLPNRTPKNDNQTPINVESTSQEKINFSDEIINEEETLETPPTPIELQAKRFEEELKHIGIYDIPNTSDIPPTFEIQDDVEIITNEFEKEQQDMIERRR